MGTTIPAEINNALRKLNWVHHERLVRLFLSDDKRTIEPRIYRLYGGAKNFELRDGKLFVYGREVVVDPKLKYKIINREEGKYGGLTKAYDRVARKYFGISRDDIRLFYSGSERRQLKFRMQKTKKVNTFLFARRPGTLQVDLTFYRGAQIPVFGAVDVFSRWCHYERVPNKRADYVVKAMQSTVAKFNSVSKNKIHSVQSDKGVEFQAEFSAYLKKNKIHYDAQAKSRKMIESLNRTLRCYVERIGWNTIKELDELIAKFVHDYNDSKHYTTKKIPNELVKLEGKAMKEEATEQFRKGKKRIGSGPGYNVADLKAGDSVRLYDPNDVKSKRNRKRSLKGK